MHLPIIVAAPSPSCSESSIHCAPAPPIEKMPHDDAACFCLSCHSGRTADCGQAAAKSVIHVGELAGAERSAVPESGMFPLANG
jgi:hypothetical protein